MIRFLSSRKRLLSEEELFEGLLRSDERVFEQLYSELRPKAINFLAGKSCPPEEAEDLFQDALLSLWQNATDGRYTLQHGTKISTYLLQICNNKWIDRTRKLAFKNTSGEDQITEMIDTAELGESKEWKYEMLDAAFAQLGPRCREMLTRFYFEEWSIADIANERGIEINSAKNEKYRCMQRLRTLCQSSKPNEHV